MNIWHTNKPKSSLFGEQFDLNDPFQISNQRSLSTGTLQTTFDRVLVKSGLRTIEHETEMVKNRGRVRKEVSRFNGFRKFFNTNLIRSKVNPAVKEMLMGHSIDLDDNYYRPSSDEILEEYLKAVNLLTINEENRLKIKVKELTRKVSRFDALEEKLQAVDLFIATLLLILLVGSFYFISASMRGS